MVQSNRTSSEVGNGLRKEKGNKVRSGFTDHDNQKIL